MDLEALGQAVLHRRDHVGSVRDSRPTKASCCLTVHPGCARWPSCRGPAGNDYRAVGRHGQAERLHRQPADRSRQRVGRHCRVAQLAPTIDTRALTSFPVRPPPARGWPRYWTWQPRAGPTTAPPSGAPGRARSRASHLAQAAPPWATRRTRSHRPRAPCPAARTACPHPKNPTGTRPSHRKP